MAGHRGEWVSLGESTYTGVILRDFGPEGSRAHRPNRREGTYPLRAGSFASSGWRWWWVDMCEL